MTAAYLGIGSNVGERRVFCRRAVAELQAAEGISVELDSEVKTKKMVFIIFE